MEGLELHYVEYGQGEPLVLLHGAFDDYRSWEQHLEPLAATARVVALSRRYSFPNNNTAPASAYTPLSEGRELTAFLTQLGLGSVWLVGISSGALAALSCALLQPALVRGLILCEPPILGWLPRLPGGQKLYDELLHQAWRPVATDFSAGRDRQATRRALDWFLGQGMVPGVGSFAELPAEAQDYVVANSLEWKIWTLAPEPFPDLPARELQQLTMPVLLLGGERSLPLHHAIDAELQRLLPHAQRVLIPGATHDMWNVAPDACRQAVLDFISGSSASR